MLMLLAFSLVVAAMMDWRQFMNGQLGAAYWTHATYCTLLPVLCWGLPKDAIAGNSEEDISAAYTGLLVLGVVAHGRWATSLWSTPLLPKMLVCVIVGGPAMLLTVFLLEIGDASNKLSPSSYRRGPGSLSRSVIILFASCPLFVHLWPFDHLFGHLPGFFLWVFSLQLRICASLLWLSVLELNFFFHLRFTVWFITRTSNKKSILISTLFNTIAHIAYGIATLGVNQFISSTAAWTLHLAWLALDDR